MLKQGKYLEVGDVIFKNGSRRKIARLSDFLYSADLGSLGKIAGSSKIVEAGDCTDFMVGHEEWVEIEPVEPIGLMVGAGP